jgi:hypothetical protein
MHEADYFFSYCAKFLLNFIQSNASIQFLNSFFMIEVIKGLPPYVAGFQADDVITGRDYDEIINPIVEKIYKEFGKINYLLVINTPLGNYTVQAWIKDALLGFVYFTQWRKIAIVSKMDGIKTFTNVFGKLIPGQTKGFMMDQLAQAKEWISEK